MILDEYPKEVTLKDGSTLTVRPMVAKDEAGLLAFFQGLSEAERMYLRDDVSDPAVIKGWAESVDYNRVLPILALDGDRVVGDATLHRNPHSWMRHVGEIRIVVSQDFREKGLARLLAAEVFQNAVTSGLEKLVAEMLTSLRSVEDLLALARTATEPLERQGRSCEALCYAGLEAERAGDRIRAEECYQAAVDTGATPRVPRARSRTPDSARPVQVAWPRG